MGGQAFASKGLAMPRMPPDVYEKVLARVQSQLRTIYAVAETPIEGPAKIDFGDVDVLVVAKDSEELPIRDEVMKLLGAEHVFATPKSSTTHFALPWPEDAIEGEMTQKEHRFIQVDVNLCPTVTALRYTLFQHAHGDMWSILGAMLRRFGFTTSSSAFYIRIPELETWNKNLSRVKLSDDPSIVLRYLGLDEQRYWSRFDSWDQAMDYAGTCRFHDPSRGRELDEDVETSTKLLDVKCHDRRKSKKRGMFRYWMETYLPMHRDDPVGSTSQMTREEVVNDAKEFFGVEVAAEFDRMRESGMRTVGIESLWSDVRKSLPCEGSDLTYALKGLKFEVMEPAALDEDPSLADVQKAYTKGDFDAVRRWTDDNWKVVKERQERRDREKSTAKLRAHLEKHKELEADTT